ncbi:hypothetical protein A2U01_0055676, partial [Trifolium medium]|nr:hypothetical protein [Trifolium medium]
VKFEAVTIVTDSCSGGSR